METSTAEVNEEPLIILLKNDRKKFFTAGIWGAKDESVSPSLELQSTVRDRNVTVKPNRIENTASNLQ